MVPKFALFTKGSKLPLNKGFKNMFELLQSCAQPLVCSCMLICVSFFFFYHVEPQFGDCNLKQLATSSYFIAHFFLVEDKAKCITALQAIHSPPTYKMLC